MDVVPAPVSLPISLSLGDGRRRVRRLAVAFTCAAALALAACSDPKSVVVSSDLPTFARTQPAVVARLKGDDLALFQRFLAEYEATAVAPKSAPPLVEVPRRFVGHSLGQVLDAAKAYFAAKDVALAARQKAVDERYASFRERAEYSAPLDESQFATRTVEDNGAGQAIEREVLRGGPHGEPRIFESVAEQRGLVNGQTPRFMNAQFRYYLVDVVLMQPKESGCPQPVLAVKLAVESLHGTPTTSIYGKFTFTQAAEGDASAGAVVASPLHADLIGPFSEKQGGIAYITAYIERTTPIVDGANWAKIASIAAARRKVWFAPEAFYYPGGEQYVSGAGRTMATRAAKPCGG